MYPELNKIAGMGGSWMQYLVFIRLGLDYEALYDTPDIT